MQPDEFADLVVLTVKSAMAPVLERLVAAETRLAGLGDVRDRLISIETKAANPPPAVLPSIPDPPPAIDLSPVLERIAAAEARLTTLGDLRDRLVTVETKAAVAPIPVPDLAPVLDRVARLEIKGAEVAPILATVAEVARDVGALRERVAVVEVKPSVPGPPGEPGPPGRDGVDGKDGSAGLSFEGVYQEGKHYEPGHLVTWAGSSWHCNESTVTKPGDGSKAWTLMVKRGRDGKDGRDAPQALPIVSVGGRV